YLSLARHNPTLPSFPTRRSSDLDQKPVKLEVIRTDILEQQVEVVNLFSKELEYMRIDGFRRPFSHDIAEAVIHLDLIYPFESGLAVRQGDQHRTVKVEIRFVKSFQNLEARLERGGHSVASTGYVDANVFVKVAPGQKIPKGRGGIERLTGE